MLELEGGIIGALPPYVLLGAVLEFVLFGVCALELDVLFNGALEFVVLGDCVL